jgi:hypothetical protein
MIDSNMIDSKVTVGQVFLEILRDPFEYLIRRWNWKSVIFSPGLRAIIFLCVNLRAGWRAALSAALIELLYRTPTAGIYGALTQAFRKADPAWAAGVTVMVLLPLVSHSIEFLVHYLHGTPKLGPSIIASVCFTALATLFNLFAMRRGVLVVGRAESSLASDMRQIPRTILAFLVAGPIALYKGVCWLGMSLANWAAPPARSRTDRDFV